MSKENKIRVGENLKERKEDIDLLRILACIGVIFNHTNERGFLLYLSYEPGSSFFIYNLICSILCKSAVPIFFMISGTMLLKKEEAVSKTLKRIPKIFVDLILFSLLYFWIDAKQAGNQFSIIETLHTMAVSNYWHLWYLYAYIAFIISLPFLRKMADGLNLKAAKYMFVTAALIAGVLPIVEYFDITLNGNLKLAWVCSNIVIYPIMGYVLNNLVNYKKLKLTYLLLFWTINIVSIITSVVCEYYFLAGNPENKYAETFLTNFCLINAVTVFFSIKYLFEKRKFGYKIGNIITGIGKDTFGIYLLHILFLWKIPFFSNIWNCIEHNPLFGQNAGVFLSCIMVFILAGITTHFLRKVPVIRKLF